MLHHSLFEITPDQIAALDDEGLRLLIAHLCESELRRRGFPTTAVLYGGNQIAADGGIDVRVELPAETVIAGAVPRPITGFQAKADDMPASEITKEMRPKVKRADGTTVPSLRSSIRALGAVRGAYVIVSSKDSTTDSMLKDRRDAMARAVTDLERPDALYLDFYDRQRMATWVSEYPGEMLWLRARIGQPLPGWRPYGNWSGAPEVDDNEYLSDDTSRLTDMRDPEGGPCRIDDGIARLRSLLSEPKCIVRLTGLSGTGKTRLLEALFDQSIGDQTLDPALAVYVDIGHEAPEPSPGQLAHQLTAEGKRTLLLMDNCPRETHDAIANVCKAPESSLSLITVNLDIADEKPEDTDVFRLGNASETVIEALVERRYPTLDKAICQRIAEFSNGNARIANLAAQRVGPDANLADLGDEALFGKLFHQHKQVDETLLRAAEALALVYSFDGETLDGASAELPFIAERADLSTREVYRAVAELQRREIVQSRGRWRAILPQPLANWLARRALQNLPALLIANSFWQSGNPRLLKSFAHRLSYLHDSDQARAIAMDWLATDGRLANLSGLDQLGFDVINYLAPVAPDAALDLIERNVSALDPQELTFIEFRHRGPVMFLLRKLAFFPKHFRRAVFLLSRFIQAEPDPTNRHHDGRHFQELFSAVLSGTQASPQQRREVVEELMADPDDRAQVAGMLALTSMLRVRHFSSSHHFAFGGRSVDFGWLPRTRTDYETWYCGALEILKQLATVESTHRTTARKLIAESFRDLWSFAHVFNCLEETSIAVGTDKYWPEGWLAVRQTLHWDGGRMTPSLISRLQSLEEQLAPREVSEEVRAYVLIPATDVADARRWESGEEYQRSLDTVLEKARELGRQVGKDLDSIGSIWLNLFGPNAAQGICFGEGVAETVADLSMSWAYLIRQFRLANQVTRKPNVLGGFLRGAALRDKEAVDLWLTDAVTDDLLGGIFPLLQVAVGVDNAGAQRLIKSIQTGLAPAMFYRELAWGRTSASIAPVDLSRLILGIADQPDGYPVAADILSMHFHRPEESHEHVDQYLIDCGRKLLRKPAMFEATANLHSQLEEIAAWCLNGSGSSEDVADLCARIREEAARQNGLGMQLIGLIDTLIQLHPTIVLDSFLATGSEEWWFDDLFGVDIEDRNMIDRVPGETLLAWAKYDPNLRFPRLALAVKVLKKEQGVITWTQTALTLLKAAPCRAAVFRNLMKRLKPTSWSGSRADLLEQRRPLIRPFFEDDDPDVRQTARVIDRAFGREIEVERSQETSRDERFE